MKNQRKTIKPTLSLIIIMVMGLGGIWSCASAPRATSSTASADQGDRELKRGIYWYQKGCMNKAMDHFHAAHEHYSLADRQDGVARSLNSLANVYRQTGNPDSARLFYDAAIAVGRRCGDRTVLAQALANKAAALIDADELSAAEVLLDEAKRLPLKKGPVLALVLNNQAVMMMKARRFHEAETLLDQADAIASDDGSNTAATLHFTRARLLMQTGENQEALLIFEQALALDRQAGFSRGIADDLAAMAELHERLGDDEAALDCLDRSIKIHALLENRVWVREHLDPLERLAHATGNDVRVTVHFVDRWLSGRVVDAICR